MTNARLRPATTSKSTLDHYGRACSDTRGTCCPARKPCSEMRAAGATRPASPVIAYPAALEVELREALGMQRRWLPLGKIAAMLAGRTPAGPAIDPGGSIERLSRGPHRSFWGKELPSVIDVLVKTRDAAAHGRFVGWDDAARIREAVIGKDSEPGLLQRILNASPHTLS
jgi:hypothetical protein